MVVTHGKHFPGLCRLGSAAARMGQAADVFRKAKGLLTHPDRFEGIFYFLTISLPQHIRGALHAPSLSTAQPQLLETFSSRPQVSHATVSPCFKSEHSAILSFSFQFFEFKDTSFSFYHRLPGQAHVCSPNSFRHLSKYWSCFFFNCVSRSVSSPEIFPISFSSICG